MDRPEDVEPNPVNGKVFVVMTGSVSDADANIANPRRPNPYGHVIELSAPTRADGSIDHTGDVFAWDIFLLAGDPRNRAHDARYRGSVSEADGSSRLTTSPLTPRGGSGSPPTRARSSRSAMMACGHASAKARPRA